MKEMKWASLSGHGDLRHVNSVTSGGKHLCFFFLERGI